MTTKKLHYSRIRFVPNDDSDIGYSNEYREIQFFGRTVAIALMFEATLTTNNSTGFTRLIAQSLVNGFLSSTSRSALIAFEDGLKQANKEIEHRLQSSEKNILNGGAILIDENEVHFSTIGSVEVMLFRNDKLTHIPMTKGDEGPTLFSTVSSGELVINQWFALAKDETAQILEKVPPISWRDEELKNLQLDIQSLVEEGQELFGIALRHQLNAPTDEVTIKAPSSIEELVSPAMTQDGPLVKRQPKENFLDKLKNRLKPPDGVEEPEESANRDEDAIADIPADTRQPSISDQVDIGEELLPTLIPATDIKKEPSDKSHQNPIVKEVKPYRRLRPATIPSDETIRYPRAKPQRRSVVGFLKTIFSWLISIFAKLKPVFFRIKSWRALFILLFLLVIVFSVVYVRNHWSKTVKKLEVPSLVSEIKSSPSDQLEQSLSDKLTPQAYSSLNEADKTELINLAKAQGITIFSPDTPVSQIPSTIALIDHSSTIIYFLDVSGQLWKFADNTAYKIDQTKLIPNAISLTSINDKTVVVGDQTGNLWLFDGTSTQPTQIALPIPLSKGPKLVANFSGNLYLYVRETKTIYKVAGFQKEIASPSLYTTLDVLNITDIIDWTINGDIIALDNNGQIISFRGKTRGTLAIDLKQTDARLASSSESTDIFASAGKLVYKFDAKGNSIGKVFVVAKEKISTITRSADGKNCYITTGNTIYQLPGS